MSRHHGRQLGALARLFSRLSLTAFGGPAAHIALMHEEVVRKRGWLNDGEFLDLVGASNVIPGPTSTEVAMHTGRRRAGGPGLVVAGLAFIVPAALVMGMLAWLYRRYGTTPAAGDFFYGVKPVVVVIVVRAVSSLGRAAVKSTPLAAIGAGALGAYLLGITEPVVLFVAAAVCGVAVAAAGAAPGRRGRPGPPRLPAILLAGPPLVAAGAPGAGGDRLGEIFLVFGKVGALLFGSGYVLFAFLQRDLVEARHWLTESQLLDAIAVGQFTPGPLFTTATFIGYLLAGTAGAVVATVGIFLPSFAFVAAMGPVLTRVRRSATASAALDGLNAAAVALMAGVAIRLSQDAIVDPATLALAVVAAGMLWRGKGKGKGNSAWLIAGGGAVGMALRSFS